MDSKYGEVRKIHIVYFLSRGGHIEHPHMIKVHPVLRNGVRLKDVKRWLANIRGKDMPSSFSWSYKRRYKAGYVWQDLCDDDLITPICDNEYILKGSEILPCNQDMCKCGEKSLTQSVLVEELHNKDQLKEASKLMLKDDLPKPQTDCKDLQNYSEAESTYIVNQDVTPRSTAESEDNRPRVEYFTKTSGNSPSKSLKDSGEVVKTYMAVRSFSSGPKLDAGTQTGESKRHNSDRQGSPPFPEHVTDTAKEKNLEKSGSSKDPEELQKSSSYSKLSCLRNDAVSSFSESNKFPSKVSRQGKAKAAAASNVLRQLFTCGGLETRDSGIRSVKTLTFHCSPNEENRSQGTPVDSSGSSTPLKKSESQTRSLSLSGLLSPETKSVITDSAHSEGNLNQSDKSKRDLQNGPKSSPDHSSSSSSGEFAAVNVVDISTSDVNSYCQDRQPNEGLQVSPSEVTVNGPDFSVKSSPPKSPHSPASLLDGSSDQTNLPNPKTASKITRRNKSTEISSNGKHNVESNCLQCGRLFKAENLKAHSKYCRGPKNAFKSRKTVVAK